MSFRVVRNSKFRHLFGNNAKRDQCYDNIRVSKSSWDSTFCCVNPKFIAVVVESGGGGAFLVLPLSKTGRLTPDTPLVGGHKGPVLDIAWCPHNDNVIASASEDCYVKVWQIPDGGLTRTITDPIVDLLKHQRRVGLVLWHPSAQNILLSAGSDNNVVIWNVGTAEALMLFTLPDLVFSGSWNWNGSEVLFTCKDRKIRRVNPRTGEVLEEAIAHEGNKASRALYLKNGLIFTTGFTRSSERQYSLRSPGHLDEPICINDLDTSNGVMFPLYDPDANVIYLCGKGDSVIRYFEITPEAPFVHYINTFQCSDPQRAIGLMPRRGCDVTTCEMARFFRMTNNGFCQVIPFVVPRKSELFQEDLYPDTLADTAAITAEEWWSGVDADPITMPMTEAGAQVKKQEELVVQKKASVFENSKPVASTVAASNPVSTASANSADMDLKKLTATLKEELRQLKADFNRQLSDLESKHEQHLSDLESKHEQQLAQVCEEFQSEIRKLKVVIVKHETRFRTLESGACNEHGDANLMNLTNNNGNCKSNHVEQELDPDEV